MPPVALLLAAGRGRRYRAAAGLADVDKLMVPLGDGRPLVLTTAQNIFQALPQVVAVVRDAEGPVTRTLQDAGLQTVLAPDADQGMGHSLAAGVRASLDAPGWIVCLADMPFIQVDTIRQLARAMRTPQALVAPTYRGQRGHPVGFGAAHGPALARLSGDEGARALLRQHRAALQLIEVDDAGVLADIDLPCATSMTPAP